VRASWLAVIAGFVFGAAIFLSFPTLTSYSIYLFSQREPFYGSPVVKDSNKVRIRSDAYGKGYFGASRNGGRIHKGIDLITEVGQPIFAAKSGRVIASGDAKGYGLCVDILHPDGLWTRYAHLSSLGVKMGDWVSKGQVLGNSGKTGNASNPRIIPHLHFEIRSQDNALNPSQNLLDPSILVS
jgi:murein DD-endopeptidase MepM/ murein hydrolase activator NlpD